MPFHIPQFLAVPSNSAKRKNNNNKLHSAVHPPSIDGASLFPYFNNVLNLQKSFFFSFCHHGASRASLYLLNGFISVLPYKEGQLIENCGSFYYIT